MTKKNTMLNGNGRRWLLTSALVVLAAGTSVRGQWPQFGGPGRDFKANAKSLSIDWEEGGPETVWMEEIAMGASPPVVDDGVVWIMDRFDEFDESVYPRNAISGERLSTLRYPAPISDRFEPKYGEGPVASPLMLNGFSYTVGFTGKIQCFDLKIPKVLWAASLFLDYDATPLKYGYTSSPIAYKDNVIMQVGGGMVGLISFETPYAKVAWGSPTFENSYTSPILINVDGQDQIVAMAADRTVGVDATNGKELWTIDHQNENYAYLSTPVWGKDGLLFLPAGGKGFSRMLKLEQKNGRTRVERVWSSNKDELGYGNVIRVDDYLYGSSGSDGASFITAVNAKTGEIAWREKGFARAAMVYGDKKFIIRDAEGYVAIATLTPKKMTVHSKARVLEPGPCSAPALVRRTLFIRDHKTVMALDLR
ncbi:MAG: PQQ-binding-like beta-propeller repeat protein [Planctomycetes bacterium]|nr:PQQ-binding-like beta-propeller repeat protein [Planctomycetota bacterium]